MAVVMAGGSLGIAAIILAAAGFAPIWEHGALGAGNIAAAVLWGGIAIAPAVALYLALSAFPRITDVSTDTVDPPLYKV
ncbi:hypothetical protein J8J40_32395, partial [Mycobacterium tuberculosis]|nr:hypothetical protein [Mycobacterium tuberculosis]